MRKRTEFENALRRQRHHIGTWVKYALFEVKIKEFTRARSVFERALQVLPIPINKSINFVYSYCDTLYSILLFNLTMYC